MARNHLGEILGEEGFATCVAAGAAIEFPTAAARYAREQIALAMSRRAIESAGKIGSVLARTLAYSSHGTACTLGQDWQGARDSLAFALELGRVHQAARFMDAYYVAALAEAQLGLGDALAMREAAGQAVEMARRMRVPVAETPAQRLPKAAKRYS